jgi:hypothetical protein
MTANAECLRIVPINAISTFCFKRGAKVSKMF